MKISAFGYNYNEPFSKDQVPNKVGEFANNFYEVEMETKQLGDYFKNNIVWSPFLFEGGKRVGKYNKGLTWCLVMDYDDGRFDYKEIYQKMIDIEEFGFLRHYQVIFYSSPRDGQEGLHKYRIVIPFEKPLNINNDDWVLFYQRVMDLLAEKDIVVDKTKDFARMFYSVDFAEVFVLGDKAISDFGIIYRLILRSVMKKKQLMKFGSPKTKGQYQKDIEGFYRNSTNFQGRVSDVGAIGSRGVDQYKLMCYLAACEFSQQEVQEFKDNHGEVNWEDDDWDRAIKSSKIRWVC